MSLSEIRQRMTAAATGTIAAVKSWLTSIVSAIREHVEAILEAIGLEP
jgi:hypothetical protein